MPREIPNTAETLRFQEKLSNWKKYTQLWIPVKRSIDYSEDFSALY